MIGSIIILYSVEKPIFDRARERLDWIRETIGFDNPRVGPKLLYGHTGTAF